MTKIKPITKIVFHWLDDLGVRRSFKTTYTYFKSYAIELLEQEQLDIVSDIYYTIDNLITKKLDYYNEKL